MHLFTGGEKNNNSGFLHKAVSSYLMDLKLFLAKLYIAKIEIKWKR
jgi:hypothetical protein